MNKLDHIGIAVNDLEQSLKEYEQIFGFQLESRDQVPSQHVNLAFMQLANTKIELLTPTSTESKLHSFLEKRGPGLHHVCYEVEDIERELAKLKDQGCQLIDEKPRPGAHGTLIAFIHPKDCSGVLTELCQYV